MDVSPEYVKMYEKAVESEPLAFTNFDRTKNVQDQLQEMVGGDWVKVLNDFVWWVQSEYGTGVDEFVFEECKDFTSMEQLWLAFVMKSLYQKTWNGTDWVCDLEIISSSDIDITYTKRTANTVTWIETPKEETE